MAAPVWATTACSGTSELPLNEIEIAAASSIRPAMEDLAQHFEETHPGTVVTVEYGGSTLLAEGINKGETPDVFVSDDWASMARVIRQEKGPSSAIIARNRLVLIRPVSNPGEITDFTSLMRPGVEVAQCVTGRACGVLANEVWELKKTTPTSTNYLQQSREVVATVADEQVDAGLAFVTDALWAENDVSWVEIPETDSVRTTYHAALIPSGAQTEAANQFTKFLTTDEARHLLANRGFDVPDRPYYRR